MQKIASPEEIAGAISQALFRIRARLADCIDRTLRLEQRSMMLEHDPDEPLAHFQLIEGLIGELLEGRLTADQMESLGRLLQADPQAQRLYLRQITTHAMLQWELAQALRVRSRAGRRTRARRRVSLPATSDSTGSAPLNVPPSSPVLGFLGDIGRQGCGFVADHTTFFSMLAALVLVAGLVAMTVPKGRDEGRNPHTGFEVADHKSEISNPNSPLPGGYPLGGSPLSVPIARLTRTVDCNWGVATAPPEMGTTFAAGQKISLYSGAIELVFNVGVRTVVQGPATLDLVAPGKVFLHAGKIGSEVINPAAHGFEIQTPKGSVVDLGTEFGVEVTPSQDVQVHVFKGEVVVQQPPGQRPAGSAKPAAGQHVLVNQGLRIEGGIAAPWLVQDSGETFIRTIDDAQRNRHVVAYWRFEDQPLGSELSDTKHNTKPARATVDSSFNGNDLYTYSDKDRPAFAADVPAGVVPRTGSPNHSCLDTSLPTEDKGLRNVYTHSEFSHAAPLDIQKITPAQWTIEASVNSAKRTE